MRQRIQKWNRLYWVGWIWLIGFLGMMAEVMVSGLISMNRLTVALIGSATRTTMVSARLQTADMNSSSLARPKRPSD